MRILLLGGTGEGRRLAGVLSRHHDVVSSLAGRISAPTLPEGEVRIGGFGGAGGLASWLREQRISALVDATHPYAQGITANAVVAARAAQVPLLVVHRAPWHPVVGDTWRWADTMDDACMLADTYCTPVFLTIGRQELRAFEGLPEVVARVIEPPGCSLPSSWHVITQRGPFSVSDERALMERHRIGVVVTKNSGGDQTCAKLVAARQLGIPVVMVCRPALPSGTAAVSSPRAAVQWIDALTRGAE